jgi:hypothetical protein
VPLLKERAMTFDEARTLLTGELSTLFEKPTLDRALLIAKAPSTSPDAAVVTSGHLRACMHLIELLHEGTTSENIKTAVMPYADAISKEDGGRGAVLWPLRYALSGMERSPDPFTLISILGIAESVVRIQTALDILGE